MTTGNSIASTLHKKLHEILVERRVDAPERQEQCRRIANHVMATSKTIQESNFKRIAESDLANMILAYDELFFDKSCVALAQIYGMKFRLSSRMTRAGGKTTRTTYPAYAGQRKRVDYEIALSTSLLFQTFRDDERKIRVCGLPCSDRLEAMQRIVEHELIHLSEMLVWIDSECAAKRFQNIAFRLFGHTEHRHELVTQYERAKAEFNIRLGDSVKFRVDSRELIGRVNRITRRATVLVESSEGPVYSDGKQYIRFYVPLQKLTRV